MSQKYCEWYHTVTRIAKNIPALSQKGCTVQITNRKLVLTWLVTTEEEVEAMRLLRERVFEAMGDEVSIQIDTTSTYDTIYLQ
jgi:hypothetical protein